MKNKINLIVSFAIFIVPINLLAQVLKPLACANPWNDNYANVMKIEERAQWGTYNVHDPSCKKFGDTYYMYSTDAILGNPTEFITSKVKVGNIQVRSSKDLVHWTFNGWAFDSIPNEAVKWVRSNTNRQGATNIWAPYVMDVNGKYRLYYCVSVFGKNDSYIGLAESNSPKGPWIQKGCVVKTNEKSKMNAIDPTVIEDYSTGELWMIYGSYFGGIFALQLNNETGLAQKEGDEGHLVAIRANYHVDNMEAPEAIYEPKLKKYFLFVSYGPLMTTYNVRVGVADHPQGPYKDYFGRCLADTINAFPILTAPYRFDNHSGWAGVGHCTVFDDGKGHYFMAHQGRLSPQNMFMDLHVRRIFFTKNGWPVVSPERYYGDKDEKLTKSQLIGDWEIIRIEDKAGNKKLKDGQAVDNILSDDEVNRSTHVKIKMNNILNMNDNRLTLKLDHETLDDVIVSVGHDWENQKTTLVFTGIDGKGCSVWGKKR
jgi:arabinan endo-1,5-alpha-L-arabinosidase